jgi:hypothetical protein
VNERGRRAACGEPRQERQALVRLDENGNPWGPLILIKHEAFDRWTAEVDRRVCPTCDRFRPPKSLRKKWAAERCPTCGRPKTT